MKKSVLLFFVLFTGSLFASGFQINEHGARAMSLGGAFTGLANDASAVFYNPAGITQLRGTQILAGTTLIKPISSFRGPAPSTDEWKLEDQIFTPINFYLTQQINDDLFAGLSVTNPYGLGTKWDENWIGRYVAVETEIRTFFFTGVVSYKLMDNLSIGAGPVFAYGDVLIERKTPVAPFAGDANVKLEGDGTAFGFTIGALYKPIPELSIGVNYRSEMAFEFSGTAESTGPALALPLLPTGDISAPLDAPQNIVVGLAYKALPNLTISADYQMVGWSSYDKLEVTFEDITEADGSKMVSGSERDYEDSYILRLGAEYNMTECLDVRAGILMDKNPVKDERVDPTLPDSDRLGLNIGVGYKLTSNLSVDVAYFFLRFDERQITNSLISYTDGMAPLNGVYNSTAHLFGLNLSYKL